MKKTKPTFSEALKFWIKLGFISFGGPAGQIAIMHEFLVKKKKWISESKFLHCLNYCMILPGPEAQQLATYIGWLLHDRIGGLLAGVFFILPSVFILLLLSILYVVYGNIPVIYSAFAALKPAVIAILIIALIKIGKKSLNSIFHLGIAAASFVSIFFFNIAFPYIILSVILLSLLINKLSPTFFESQKKIAEFTDSDEAEYFLNKNSVIKNSGFNKNIFTKQLGIFAALWLLPIILFYYFSRDFSFGSDLSLFFTKAALVTFGGAYAVLPYVAQLSVEKFLWLSKLQMIDGLALGETTPGPLIMVLAFVGFMAGYNHFDFSISAAALGLLTTVFYTFLPSFFFIFIGGPIIERTQENQKIKAALNLVTAAVVGVVFNLTIYLAIAVIFPNEENFAEINYVSLVWILISFTAMQRFKINMILWIFISVLFGLCRFFITT